MTCDICKRKFNYCFYINDADWMKAVGRVEGHWCAHCVLEKIGGLDWYIIWNEQAERMMRDVRSLHVDAVTLMEGETMCCFIPNQRDPTNSRCPNIARWRIEHGETPDDYTESCTEHIGVMLTDAPEHRIYPI